MRPSGFNSGTAASLAPQQAANDPATMARGVEATARGDARAQDGAPSRLGIDSETNPVHPLQRLRVGSALDLGFDLLRHRFALMVGLAACLYLPIQLLDLFLRVILQIESPGDVSALPAGFGAVVFGADSASALGYMTAALQTVALSILGICLGHVTMELIENRRTSFGDVLKLAFRRSWVAPLIVVLSLGIRLPLSCVPIVGLFIADALVFTASIASGAERLGPLASVGRSIRLSRNAFGPAFVVSFGGFCITQVIRLVMYAGPAALLSMFSPPEGWALFVQQLSSLTLIVLQPLTACIAAAGYLMLRTRNEGFDLELRMAGTSSDGR